ncbi:unnamed protein product [Linum trigynum]|uniref:Reverse transcriptase domain-containing protein n=1 Tax=Linum trigynum TaxID=586398 RepID=A0AAV2EX91_9ROSI
MVFQIGSSKAPGSDGFTALFFQQYWDVVGHDVCVAVQSFFRSGHLLRAFNHTWLTLIPKVPNVESCAQLRPIGLCQVFYKIISKILATRLGDILPKVISTYQNGFIKDRSIVDNVIISEEVMNYLTNKHGGKERFMALKLDMENAYDRIEWPYLFRVMEKLGFDPRLIALVHTCLSTTTFSVLLNGSSYGYFHPSRGLRQGDPLSPLLLLL